MWNHDQSGFLSIINDLLLEPLIQVRNSWLRELSVLYRTDKINLTLINKSSLIVDGNAEGFKDDLDVGMDDGILDGVKIRM